MMPTTRMATKNIGTLSTARTTATMGPPCDTVTPDSIAITEPTMEPIIMLGITRRGSAAANGMTPSVIPKVPL